jgi:hypothetical protein
VASNVDIGKRRQCIVRLDTAVVVLIMVLQDVLGEVGEFDPISLQLLNYLLLANRMGFVELGYSANPLILGHLNSPVPVEL